MTTRLSVSAKQKIMLLENEEYLSIRRIDWDRIKRRVSNIYPQSKLLSNAYSILFGLGTSTLITTISLKNVANLDSWIMPLLIIVTLFSIFVACILLILEKKGFKGREDSVEDVKKDFSEIESMYGKNKQ